MIDCHSFFKGMSCSRIGLFLFFGSNVANPKSCAGGLMGGSFISVG